MSAIATISPHSLAAPDPYLPTNIEQAMKLAELVARSDLAPKDYKGKPGNVFVAMQMGHELGLSPMQSIQNIAVINGRPSVWGDALLALCQAHQDFADIIETDDGAEATCTVKRRGRTDVTRHFSMEDAKRAGLLGKQGPWSSYPARMRQMRARGFALRDAFADALRGLSSAEEQEDVVRAEVVHAATPAPQDAAPKRSAVEDTKAKLRAKKNAEQPVTLEQVLDVIEMAQTMSELDRGVAPLAKQLPEGDQAKARAAFKARKAAIQAEMDSQEPPHDADGVVTEEPHDEREPGSDDQ